MTTGEKLRRAIKREFGDMSQAKVAEELDVPPGNLSEWLNDKYEPTLDSLRKLARGLKCSAASLVGDKAA